MYLCIGISPANSKSIVTAQIYTTTRGTRPNGRECQNSGSGPTSLEKSGASSCLYAFLARDLSE